MNASVEPMPLRAKLADYFRLMRLDRPVGIYLLLWPTLWALWFAADGMPSLHVLLVFVAGTVLMRSAGCAINDFADRGFDPHVERTRHRPVASGRVTPEEAVRLFVAVSLIAFGLLTSLKNTLAIALAVPAALLAAGYPFAKRHISMPQAVLGIAFSWGIPMAYAAVQHTVDWRQAGLLMAANACWVIAYDTYYAMVDRPDDLKIGVKSSAILFGRYDRLAIIGLQALALLLLALVGIEAGCGLAYDAGLLVAAALALWHFRMTRDLSAAACFRAFVQNHWFGVAILAGLVLDRFLAA
ncbi:4-hydroxybenzoate octaprenyltransferase [Sinimarinibacterium sp. CAU 1509]|uniref:4-hydroxybenzoate octaprenyltransferase n=1 Tax=Sinimarinibacterium sp. CAU 1509 TaxID=2562283 RepID=UPI00200A1363|nr:4-hydroxybenzoate octaprenyltransferase [Sinimarinibacterium sp. CAU 1509]